MATIELVRVEDAEGDGRCGQCGREGIRWVHHLSDGTAVGGECAKKVLGWSATGKAFSWVGRFEPIAEHTETFPRGSVHHVLWRHRAGTALRATRNGHLVAVGGPLDREWIEQGWMPAAA